MPYIYDPRCRPEKAEDKGHAGDGEAVEPVAVYGVTGMPGAVNVSAVDGYEGARDDELDEAEDVGGY